MEHRRAAIRTYHRSKIKGTSGSTKVNVPDSAKKKTVLMSLLQADAFSLPVKRGPERFREPRRLPSGAWSRFDHAADVRLLQFFHGEKIPSSPARKRWWTPGLWSRVPASMAVRGRT
jgi:hypothetical protein